LIASYILHIIYKIKINGFEVSVIELAAPHPVHMYPSGLESIGVIIGKALPKIGA
jgi:hypothetical protein